MAISNHISVRTGRLRTKIQFANVLKQSQQVRSVHFVLHYCLSHLSTDDAKGALCAVDNCDVRISRLGLIIPKRWAKRAVTRSLIKRQCRAEFMSAAGMLPAGDWIIRLRRSFDQAQWISGASVALKQCVRQELQGLFQRACLECADQHGSL